MNVFFNFNSIDSWFKSNFQFNEDDLFFESKDNDFKKLLDEKLNKDKLDVSKIDSINIIVSLSNTIIINPISISKFSEFNNQWNVKLIETFQPIINFCRVNKIVFNVIFVTLNLGTQNIANIALVQILKSLIIGLNSETKSFKFLSKLFVLDKSKKRYLSKVKRLLSSKRRFIISNSKLLQQLSFKWFKKNFVYAYYY